MAKPECSDVFGVRTLCVQMESVRLVAKTALVVAAVAAVVVVGV